MSRITFFEASAKQSLGEYEVGVATDTCEFPSILQCFGLVGLSGTSMLCAHVSPGTTKDEMTDIFATLKQAGGDNVLHWYVVGPTVEHFGAGKSTIWQSLKDVKKSFKSGLNFRSTALHFLDVTEERDSQMYLEKYDVHTRISAMDVRVTSGGLSLRFDWRARSGRHTFATDWEPLKVTKFRRL